jgi:predicted ATPase
MIRRIRIEGYKSFAELDLRLSPLSVIFGPNASGKSNLFDAIYLLSRAVTCKTLAEAFEGHRGLPLESFYYGDCGYEELLGRKHLALTFEMDVELSPAVLEIMNRLVTERSEMNAFPCLKDRQMERYLRYHLKIEALPKTGVVGIVEEHLTALKKNGGEKREPEILDLSGDGCRSRGETIICAECGRKPRSLSEFSHGLTRPEIWALQAEMARWRVYYLEPRVLMREETPRSEMRSLGPRGEGLAAFLNLMQAEDSRSYRAFALAFRQIMPGDVSLELDLTKEGLVSLRVKEDGAYFSGRLISEGTLRLLGLLAALHPRSDATVVAFEEPENGVHPARLKIIADLLKEAAINGKQVLVTSHSPLLLEHFSDRELFVCRREESRSRIEPFRKVGFSPRQVRIARGLEDRIIRGDYGS